MFLNICARTQCHFSVFFKKSSHFWRFLSPPFSTFLSIVATDKVRWRWRACFLISIVFEPLGALSVLRNRSESHRHPRSESHRYGRSESHRFWRRKHTHVLFHLYVSANTAVWTWWGKLFGDGGTKEPRLIGKAIGLCLDGSKTIGWVFCRFVKCSRIECEQLTGMKLITILKLVLGLLSVFCSVRGMWIGANSANKLRFVVTVSILKCMQWQKGINDVKMLLRMKTK